MHWSLSWAPSWRRCGIPTAHGGSGMVQMQRLDVPAWSGPYLYLWQVQGLLVADWSHPHPLPLTAGRSATSKLTGCLPTPTPPRFPLLLPSPLSPGPFNPIPLPLHAPNLTDGFPKLICTLAVLTPPQACSLLPCDCTERCAQPGACRSPLCATPPPPQLDSAATPPFWRS